MLLPVILLVSSIAAAVHGGPFSATVFTPPVQRLGDEVTCQVAITNNDDVDYFLLKRNTPLDGLMSQMFSVKDKATGKELRYDGLYFKRSAPTIRDYVQIPARSSILSSVALTDAYSLDKPSVYSVSLDTPLRYTKNLILDAANTQQLLSKPSHFLLLRSSKQTRLTKAESLRRREKQQEKQQQYTAFTQTGAIPPILRGEWTPAEMKISAAAYDKAFSMAGASVGAVDSNQALYVKWFDNHGPVSNTRKQRVKTVYSSVVSVMFSYSYTLNKGGRDCQQGVFAYTTYKTREIFLCAEYFKAGSAGYDTNWGTIIHEMTHSAEDTDDHDYGTARAQQLAATDPNRAIDNADNYQFFSESL